MKTINLIFLCFLLFCDRSEAQRWTDTNRGLYPNSIGLTVNAKNHALGVKFDHLFAKPLFNEVPLGMYGSVSRTIKPNKFINNYEWENKYSIGLIFTLPQWEMSEMHNMITIGLIYYQLPGMWQNKELLLGQYYAGLKATNLIGLDIGWRAQINRFTAGFQIDAMNFFQYGQVSAGYCFSFHK